MLGRRDADGRRTSTARPRPRASAAPSAGARQAPRESRRADVARLPAGRADGARRRAGRCALASVSISALAAMKDRGNDAATSARRASRTTAPGRHSAAGVDPRQVLAQQPFVGRQHRQAADADAGAMRHRHAGDGDVFHLPEMGELVVAAAGRPRIAVRLHGKARHHQAAHQPVERRALAAVAHTGRIAEPGVEIVLHHGEGAGIERLLAQRIGQDPVGAGHEPCPPGRHSPSRP